MRTTVEIDDDLLARAKTVAVHEKRSVRSLIEEGLRTILLPKPAKKEFRKLSLPISTAKGGVRPGVNLGSNSALLDIMES